MKYFEVEKNFNTLLSMGEKKFPRKMVAAIARNISILAPINELIVKQRVEIAKKYVKKNENGDFDTFINDDGRSYLKFETVEDKNKFEEESLELENMEEDITIIRVSSSILDTLDNGMFDVLTANEEISLSFMLDYSDEV